MIKIDENDPIWQANEANIARGTTRGERYPNWFNSIFEFRQKMIQFNIQFNTISQKINSENYSIQKNLRKFNSKNYSIQKISKKFNSKNYSIQ